MRLFKDYYLEGEVLLKTGLKEKSHLIWQFGGVPAIDAELWTNYKEKIKAIRFKTDKGRTFAVDAETFERYKELVNFGYGNQYVLDKLYWDIRETKQIHET